jgi:vacuolar-type H+-ATPase catalytic subunit A/Vma1
MRFSLQTQMADSTSRWADREISGRLAEMPADSRATQPILEQPPALRARWKGQPLCPETRRVMDLSLSELLVHLAVIIASLSPPSTSTVQVFWGFDKKLAQTEVNLRVHCLSYKVV